MCNPIEGGSMKYLGLDLGTRTLGVAVSDITRTIATTYTTIRFDEDDYEKALKELALIPYSL